MDLLLKIIEFTAILVFAYSGIIHAYRIGLDWVGVLTIAIVTAFGGGTLRDVLLGNHPLFWITNWHYLVFIFLLSPIAILLIKLNKDFSSRRALMWIDALGLGLFTASGVGIALKLETPLLPAVLIGVVTATFGGVVRDVLSSQKVQLFQPTEPLYATCAFVGGWLYILLIKFDILAASALIVCVIVTFTLRILAVKYNLRLPV